MSQIRPFKGYRPNPELAERIAAPPYDVLNVKEGKALAGDNPLSFLHVEKPEIDFPGEVDTHSELVNQKAGENFQKLITTGALIRDSSPCFYIYQQTMGTHTQCGIMLGASVAEYEQGIIKKHEFTRKDKEDERAYHVDTINANTGPVMLTYRADRNIDKLVDKIRDSKKPEYDFTADDGIKHVMWVVSKPEDVSAIQKSFLTVPAMYIADGHHRSAAAFRVKETRQAKNSKPSGEEPYHFFLGVAFPDNQLKIMGYYRVVKDLNNLSPAELLQKIAQKYDVSETHNPEPRQMHCFSMYLDGRWYNLSAQKGTFPADDPIESLDVAILQKNLLEPILNLFDIRTNKRIDFVGGIRGTQELEKRCKEDCRVAFALYPTSVPQLMKVADANEVMPPKSTWFEPKLRSGMVVRSLE